MRLYSLLTFVCISFFAAAARGQVGFLDLEDLDKTMVTFERAFETKNSAALRLISHSKAQKEEYFATLAGYMSCCRISSAYSSRRARQEYGAGRDELVVDFVFRNGKWFIDHATLNGQSLAPKGFSALASEYHFTTFIDAVASGKVGQYTGVRLGNLAKKRLLPRGTTVTLLNMLIHDGTTPRDLFYVRLRKYEQIENERRGWLIDDVGSMLSYSRLRNNADPLLEFIANRTSFFDLNRPSAFAFVNLREHEPPPRTPASNTATPLKVNVRESGDAAGARSRVGAQDFTWPDGGAAFNVIFDINSEDLLQREWTAEIAADTLLLRATPALSGVRFKSHPYFEVQTEGETILLRVAHGIEKPIRSLAGARAGTPRVSRQNTSTRIIVPISISTSARKSAGAHDGGVW